MKQSLKQRLDQLHKEHGSVTFRWEGGNDSGCYYFKAGDKLIDYGEELYHELENIMDSALGYGSFAGDYYTDGFLEYVPGEGVFIGEGEDKTDEFDSVTLQNNDRIHIILPQDLWFDRLSIDANGYLDDGFDVLVQFTISNGPVAPEHMELEESLSEMIKDEIEAVVSSNDGHSCYYHWAFTKDMFEPDGNGNTVAYIDKIGYNTRETTYNTYNITIPDDE